MDQRAHREEKRALALMSPERAGSRLPFEEFNLQVYRETQKPVLSVLRKL